MATSEDATELLLKNNLNFSFKDVTRLDSNDLQSKIQIQAKNSQRQIQGHTNSNNYCKSTSTNNKQSAPSSPKITLEIPLQTCSDVVSMFEPLFGDDAKGGDQESQPTTNENETDDEDNEAIESWVDDGKNIGRDSFFEKIKDNVDVDAIISDEPDSGGQSPILDKVFADEVDNEGAFNESVADAEMLQKLLFMPIELPDGGAGAQLSSGCSIVSGEMMLSSPSSVLLFDQRVEPFPTTRRREVRKESPPPPQPRRSHRTHKRKVEKYGSSQEEPQQQQQHQHQQLQLRHASRKSRVAKSNRRERVCKIEVNYKDTSKRRKLNS